MGIIDNYCDTSFDDHVVDIEGINRLPWVGVNYKDKKQKTLVLGESVYDRNPEDPSSVLGKDQRVLNENDRTGLLVAVDGVTWSECPGGIRI